ncbi:FKBP-type peptidyl-prolyl cis-trans isomerase [Novosphingopyxis sp.]|uniref:FKBP-type peptidyl-prolyl cis-trans isomerase n=1 Tax=Novosphingopyxis sp. TaxID=2709690 RepID=UPI003B5CEB1E
MSVTAVPIRPVKQGTLTTFWIGIAVLVAVAALLVWLGTASFNAKGDALPGGATIETLTEGEGPSPAADDFVLVNYTGKLRDGTVFDQGERAPLQVDGVIPGFSQGLQKMQKGGKYRLHIPADQAYGAEEKSDPQTGKAVIPANSDLVFDVELVDFKSKAEVMQLQQQMMMQQMMQQGGQPGAGGAPGEEPGQ